MSGSGDAGALANEAERLIQELQGVRKAERKWSAARSMVDDSSWRIWHGVGRSRDLGDLGLSRVPDHVLVAVPQAERRGRDPIEEAVRGAALQRAVVALADSLGDALPGCVGEQGVAVLCAGSGSGAKKKQRLAALSERVRALSRRHGITLHCGAAFGSDSAPFSRVYQAALRAAEAARVKGSHLAFAEPDPAHSAKTLRKLREELGKGAKAGLEQGVASFEQYLEAVSRQSGDRIEAAVVHLEAGFERLTEPLAERGVLDRRSLTALLDSLERSAREAETTTELLSAYRRAAADVAAALANPVVAQHDRSVRGAIEYIREHYAEPLRLHQVARLAGLGQSHFSRLFSEHEGMPFERFVCELRLGRARQLLSASSLSVARIAELCGFNSPQYFARAFRRSHAVSPLAYRQKLGKLRPAGLNTFRRSPIDKNSANCGRRG
jgi:AraC-like DNA-binding protein